MDPITAVGLVASILQLVAAAKSVVDLGRDARNATKDQRDLFLEVQNLALLLEDLKHRLQQPNNQSVNGIQKLEKPLGQLRETMEHINRKLGSANKVGSRALMWTFWNKTEADADLAKIERFKAVLNAWLLLDNWDVGQQQQKNYNQIRQDQYQIRTELGNISQNQREYHDEIAKTLTSSSNTQRQDNYRILTEVRNVAQDQHQFLDSAERDKIIEWLSPLNFFARHDEIFRTRQEGTGRWFLEDSRFRNWLLSTGESIWCLGIPGAGKTVLTSIVVDYLRNDFQGDNTGVAAAYLNHKESEAQSPSNILAGLWWQLASERLISPLVQQLYQKHQNRHTRPSLDEVREIFCSTVAEYSKVFLVVDALDEYPEAHRYILLGALVAMGTNVSLMFTSRPNIAPEAFFPTASVLEISAQEEDIRRYVGGQIQNSFRLSRHIKARPELREEIETTIAENTDGMFLIAKLHIDSLATKSTVKAVRDALQTLPEDLEHTYDEAMDRIEAQNKDDRDIARRTLIWVVNAKRPLTVSELQEALAIEPDSKALDADGLLDIEMILSVCVGLVIVEASQWSGLDPRYSLVRLVHLTIQEYLDRAQAIHFPGAQIEITRQCLTYVSFSNVPDKLYYWQHGLLSYAAHYCLLHAAGEPELLLQDIIIKFLGDAHRWQFLGSSRYDVPSQWRCAPWPPLPSKLWVAALFGLQKIARHLLNSDKSISEEEKEGSLKAALEWKFMDVVGVLIKHGTNENPQRPFIGNVLRTASGAGHTETVQLLLAHGADVSTQGGYYGTALQAASAKQWEGVVRLLLKHGADVNVQGGHYGTALQAASTRGSNGIVQILLENGADVNLQGGHDGTALQAALVWGCNDTVQILLRNGADVNLQGGYYGTALQAASMRGNNDIIRTLLKNGADVNLQGGYYGTALQVASAIPWEGMVRLLLDHGADVNTQGGFYGTALQAASMVDINVVQLLLEHGADVNVRGGYHGNALHAALRWGKMEIVQLLLKNGAEVNLQGGIFGTALQAASTRGNSHMFLVLPKNSTDTISRREHYGSAQSRWSNNDMVQVLLKNGADVNMQGGHFGTALQAASWIGSVEVVQLLLENGADVNLQGGGYGTALQAALVTQSAGVVQLLLNHGADVNMQGGHFGTALQAAVARWRRGACIEVVQLLLKHGADVNLQGGFYGTALQAASWLENMEVVQLLLENGADVNTQGGNYGTALQAASVKGYLELVQLLLDHGANPNLQGGTHGTALQAVSRYGLTKAVQFLLEHGADVNMQGGHYGTALQAASAKGKQRVVQLLLKHGANVNTRGGKYGTAYRAAKSRGRTKVAELLIAHGADTDLAAESGSD